MAKTLEQQEAEISKLKKLVKEQATALKVAEATAPKNAKPVVTIDGEPYELMAGERTKNGITTREALAKDSQRLRELRDCGSGLLKKVNIS